MKRQDLDEKFFDLLHGNLTPEEEKEAVNQLERAGISKETIESMRKFNSFIDDAPLPEPSARMDKRFYAMAEEEQKKILLGDPDVSLRKPLLVTLLAPGIKIAAGVAIFILGWFAASWFGDYRPGSRTQMTELTSEVKQLKETLVLSMIRQSSPVERIRAVNMISELDKADNRIIESLLGVLKHDSNDNVRLLALDALIRYSSDPDVRSGLVSSIAFQSSPMVQLRLAEIMLALDEKRAVTEFQKVLQSTDLNYNVRNKMNEAVAVLL